MAIDASRSDPASAPGDSDDLGRLEPLMREALVRVIAVDHDRQPGVDEDLRVLLRELCRQAHVDGISAERLIILLKLRWMTENGGEYPSRTQAHDALNLLVTACIEAYFQGSRRKHV